MSEWIKVENGLPEEDVVVLGCNEDYTYFVRLEKGVFIDADRWFELKVTHWMRLPKRPNE